MDQNSNFLTVELNFRLQCKDYRFILGIKRTWIIAAVLAAVQLVRHLLHQ